jgi:rhamnose utilization protein RhaD (predicted bifunctional aldolase and dehydrogenase)
LDLAEVRERIKQKTDPAELDARASIETAMHAVLPHRVAHSRSLMGFDLRRRTGLAISSS